MSALPPIADIDAVLAVAVESLLGVRRARGYNATMFKWPSNGREFAHLAVVCGAFIFIMYFGLKALGHPESAEARTLDDILVFVAACGAAAFVSHVWKV